MIIFPPDLRKGRRFASSVLMYAKLGCRITLKSYAPAIWAYDSFFQRLAPLPVALTTDGVASDGFRSSSATMSVAMLNGVGTPALLPPRPPKELPRASPYHRWLPTPTCTDQALSADGGGAVPSRVWPYHSLFMACAWSGVTQLAVLCVPPFAVQITVGSNAGS